MRGFKYYHDASKWCLKHATGRCYIVIAGRIRGYDPTDGRLYVVAELDSTPMW
jgi:hypothetical protein